MNRRQAALVAWVKAHKNELILAGISITAVMVLIKNHDSIMNLWKFLRKAVKTSSARINSVGEITPPTELPIKTYTPRNPSTPSAPFLRNLHEGWQASPKKIATARENGFILAPGQTWVDPSPRNTVK